MMDRYNTVLRTVDPDVDNLVDECAVLEAAQLLQRGETVGFPTETVYGLGADATSDKAITRIYTAKGRPSDNPLIVHIAYMEQAADYTEEIPEAARRLMEAFWPGPLAIVLKHNGLLSEKVTAGLETVALRMPDHQVALALIEASKLPLAAPSANRSGKPSPTSAQHVYDDLAGWIPAVIDGGTTGVGVESTVIDATQSPMMILRPGGVAIEAIENEVGTVTMDPSLASFSGTSPKSPGMKYTHYAPEAPLVLVEGRLADFSKTVERAQYAGKRVGVLVTDEWSGRTGADQEVTLGPAADLEKIARRLYDALREFHTDEVDIIYAVTFTEEDLGGAVMNRLAKAAGGRRISPANPK